MGRFEGGFLLYFAAASSPVDVSNAEHAYRKPANSKSTSFALTLIPQINIDTNSKSSESVPLSLESLLGNWGCLLLSVVVEIALAQPLEPLRSQNLKSCEDDDPTSRVGTDTTKIVPAKTRLFQKALAQPFGRTRLQPAR